MLTVVIAVLGGAVVGLAAPAAIEGIYAGRWPTLRELTRSRVDGAVAAAVAGTWGVLAAVIGPEPELPAFLYLGWVGVVLAVIDLRHHRLPDVLVLPSHPIAFVLLGAAAVVDGEAGPVIRAMPVGVALAAFYYAIAFLSPGGLGLGDVKLGGLVGLYLGWIGWTAAVAATVLAFVSAAVVAVALMAMDCATRGSRLPFGPFMLGGALIGITCGA